MIENIYNIDFVLSQTAKMQEQTEYPDNAVEKLSLVGDGDSGDCGAPREYSGAG